MTDDHGYKQCSTRFNYCFWAKLLVAIPAIPIVAFLMFSFFIHPVMKYIGAAAGVGFVVWAAVKIDRMPSLSGKIVKKD